MDVSVNKAAPRISTGQQKLAPKPDNGPKDAKTEIEIVFHGVVTKLILATEPAGQSTQTKDNSPPVTQQSTRPENKGALLDKNV